MSARQAGRCGLVVDGADWLGRCRERGIVGVDDHLGEDGNHLSVGQSVVQCLGELVADHAFAFGSEDVERVGRDLAVRGRLQGEQSDLRTVAVRDDYVVLGCDRGDCRGGVLDVAALHARLCRLSAAEERVAAERDHYQHGSSSRWIASTNCGAAGCSGSVSLIVWLCPARVHACVASASPAGSTDRA